LFDEDEEYDHSDLIQSRVSSIITDKTGSSLKSHSKEWSELKKNDFLYFIKTFNLQIKNTQIIKDLKYNILTYIEKLTAKYVKLKVSHINESSF
jgi:hypothetical protein